MLKLLFKNEKLLFKTEELSDRGARFIMAESPRFNPCPSVGGDSSNGEIGAFTSALVGEFVTGIVTVEVWLPFLETAVPARIDSGPSKSVSPLVIFISSENSSTSLSGAALVILYFQKIWLGFFTRRARTEIYLIGDFIYTYPPLVSPNRNENV